MIRFVKMLCLLVVGSLPFVVISGVGVGLSGCSGGGDGGGTGGGSGKRDGGTGGGTGGTTFTTYDLDPAAREDTYYAMAVDPGTERVGVVYFTPAGVIDGGGFIPSGGADGGFIKAPPGSVEMNYDLKYVEWKNGVASAPERLRSMQRLIGVSLAFDPKTHEPVTAFLGGDPAFIEGKSIYWYQNDTAVMRKTGGTWRETDIATISGSPPCSPIDQGFLEGLYSTVIFDSTGKMYVAFRDGHNGEFPQQDWAASDVEVMEGASETSLTRRCLTGDHKQAYGGRIQLAIGAGDQPAIIYDQAFGGAETTGQNVLFQQRKTDGSWTSSGVGGFALLTISNTMSGASIAYDATEGYGIAVTDKMTSQLSYIKSADGAAGHWSAVDPAFGTGTGGWYPSLAMDPMYHEPAIAFYVCSPRNGTPDTSCLQSDDELRITQRIGTPGTWREVTVDASGGWSPKLAFFASGKRVVAYRTPAALDSTAHVNPTAGIIRLAVEQ